MDKGMVTMNWSYPRCVTFPSSEKHHFSAYHTIQRCEVPKIVYNPFNQQFYFFVDLSLEILQLLILATSPCSKQHCACFAGIGEEIWIPKIINHNIFSVNRNKIGLNCYQLVDKQILLACSA